MYPLVNKHLEEEEEVESVTWGKDVWVNLLDLIQCTNYGTTIEVWVTFIRKFAVILCKLRD